MRSQLNRADLLQCLASHDAEEWERLVGALGYETRIVHQCALNGVVMMGGLVSGLKAPEPTPVVETISSPTRFLRPLSRRRLGAEGSTEPAWFQQANAFTQEDDPDIAAPQGAKPPPVPPLMPWPRLWPFLKLALGAVLATHRPDLPKVVETLARGEWLRRLPRTSHPGWAGEAWLVIDFAEPLVPFWGDFHGLKQRLPSLRGQSGLTVMAFPDGDPLGRCWREDGEDWQPMGRFPWPKPATPVLVLSDLGCTDREPDRRQRWLRFGARLKRAGCRPVALLPCPPRRWDRALAGLFDLACWDRAARLPRQRGERRGFQHRVGLDARDNAETLLALLSPAIRVEPGLLRAARWLLPADQADVGTEATAWNHADVRPTLTAFYYDAAVQASHRLAFQTRFELATQLAIARLTAEYHAPLSPFILHEEALVLQALLGQEALAQAGMGSLAGQLADAERLQQRLAKTCAGNSPLAEASKAWLARLSNRSQPVTVWEQHEALEVAWAYAHREALAQGRVDTLPPGLSLSRVAWVLAGQRAPGTWTLRQIGGMLYAEPERRDSGEEPNRVGLSGRKRGIHILDVASTAPYASLSPIAEADAAGLVGFLHPQAQPVPSPSVLLSVIHPVEFSQSPEPSPATPLALHQPIPLPEAPLFRLSTDREDWLFDQIGKPEWADAIGRDRQGLYVEVQAGPERLRLDWLPGQARDGVQARDAVIELTPPPHGGRLGGGRSNGSEASVPSALVSHGRADLQIAGTWGGFETLGRDEFGVWAEVALYSWKHMTVNDPVNTPMSYFNRVAQRFRRIPPGRFLMGSPQDEPELESFGADETQHEVTLSRGFWLADSATTQAWWQAVMGNNPSRFQNNSNNPVETVSWNDAQAFIAQLNAQVQGLSARLPTEAEWEYACRAGTTTPFSFGANITPEMVNYDGNYPYAGGVQGQYREQTVPVKSLPPNPWGLYEMHGNVWEWCQDWFSDYPRGLVADPTGPPEGQYRVLRGGSWIDFGWVVRSAYRDGFGPDFRSSSTGFRLALVG
jgi:formylglycine-generating enzyme required for sulfatase activity